MCYKTYLITQVKSIIFTGCARKSGNRKSWVILEFCLSHHLKYKFEILVRELRPNQIWGQMASGETTMFLQAVQEDIAEKEKQEFLKSWEGP